MTAVTSEELLQLLRDIERRSLANAQGLPHEEVEQLWAGVLSTIVGVPVIAPLDEVREILNYPSAVTPVPGTKSWVLGIANVRGNLLPIMDLQQFLGGVPIKIGRRSRVLVINHQDLYAGLLVDGVQGMRHFSEEQLTDVPILPETVRKYISKAYVTDGGIWSVFSLKLLAEKPDFHLAAA